MEFNMYYGIGFLSVTIASFSQILLKKGALRKYPNWVREYLNGYVITGYFFMFLSVFLTIIVYSGVTDFLIVPMIESIGYVLVPILSYFYFREALTLRKIVGISFIMLGMVVYNL